MKTISVLAGRCRLAKCSIAWNITATLPLVSQARGHEGVHLFCWAENLVEVSAHGVHVWGENDPVCCWPSGFKRMIKLSRPLFVA